VRAATCNGPCRGEGRQPRRGEVREDWTSTSRPSGPGAASGAGGRARSGWLDGNARVAPWLDPPEIWPSIPPAAGGWSRGRATVPSLPRPRSSWPVALPAPPAPSAQVRGKPHRVQRARQSAGLDSRVRADLRAAVRTSTWCPVYPPSSPTCAPAAARCRGPGRPWSPSRRRRSIRRRQRAPTGGCRRRPSPLSTNRCRTSWLLGAVPLV
jgi:hypothetical protein